MRAVAFLLLLATLCGVADAAPLPNDAAIYLPVLSAEIDRFWPDLEPREFIPALAEQESLGRIDAELKTSREYGCGIGQFTKTYNADGSIRFDSLSDTRRLDKSLAGWTWEDCANVIFQARGIVIKSKTSNRNCSALMAGNYEVKACDAAQHNGGAGSVAKRIRLCRMKPGCNPRRWFGNLEFQVVQSTKRVAGYGESFDQTNSRYPGRVFARMPKYKGKV